MKVLQNLQKFRVRGGMDRSQNSQKFRVGTRMLPVPVPASGYFHKAYPYPGYATGVQNLQKFQARLWMSYRTFTETFGAGNTREDDHRGQARSGCCLKSSFWVGYSSDCMDLLNHCNTLRKIEVSAPLAYRMMYRRAPR